VSWGQSRTKLRYLDLNSFKVVGESGGYRAAFGCWAIWMKLRSGRDPEKIIEVKL
jgi:hypothetical protein